jgi:quercetin dioxygenase-like cupin family protein|tara:strand:- start:1459 stop:1791 length:333 start_codon:yes stop_codon:yes gene_type:complete
MKTYKLDDFYKGWIMGNFDPALIRTTEFEVGIHTHKKGGPSEPHYQLTSYEYNVIIKGKLIANEKTLSDGDIFVYDPNIVCHVEFLEDTTIVCVKTPSVGPEDKVLAPVD